MAEAPQGTTAEVAETEAKPAESLGHFMFREHKVLRVYEKATTNSDVVGKIHTNDILPIYQKSRGFAKTDAGWFEFDENEWYKLME